MEIYADQSDSSDSVCLTKVKNASAMNIVKPLTANGAC